MWIVEKAVVEAFLDVVRPNVSQLIVVNLPQHMEGASVSVANEDFGVFQGLVVRADGKILSTPPQSRTQTSDLAKKYQLVSPRQSFLWQIRLALHQELRRRVISAR
jgi:hypothetical protein